MLLLGRMENKKKYRYLTITPIDIFKIYRYKEIITLWRNHAKCSYKYLRKELSSLFLFKYALLICVVLLYHSVMLTMQRTNVCWYRAHKNIDFDTILIVVNKYRILTFCGFKISPVFIYYFLKRIDIYCIFLILRRLWILYQAKDLGGNWIVTILRYCYTHRQFCR